MLHAPALPAFHQRHRGLGGVGQGDLDAIESFEHLGEAFKWKIAFHYQNRQQPAIVDIFKRAPLASSTDLTGASNLGGDWELEAKVGAIETTSLAATDAPVLLAGDNYGFATAINDAGVKAIVQPGGSVRDAEVIAAADERGIAMVFTGVRHFRH